MKAATYHAIFADGAIVSADSPTDLEIALRDDDWNPSSLDAFREAMAHRAKVWSGTRINPSDSASSWAFLRELERAGILRLEIETDDGLDTDERTGR